MAKFTVWFEEKRRLRQYESVTIGYQREGDDETENPEVVKNIIKATVFKWSDEILRERTR
jgi:hypothetical protein